MEPFVVADLHLCADTPLLATPTLPDSHLEMDWKDGGAFYQSICPTQMGLSEYDQVKVCHQNEVSRPLVCQTTLQMGKSEQSLNSNFASACDPTSVKLTLGICV